MYGDCYHRTLFVTKLFVVFAKLLALLQILYSKVYYGVHRYYEHIRVCVTMM